ncbi:SDR family NAD(P)-dependent oxidoreductase [Thermoflavimicrobium dichotomicum]|uniref:Short-chain dehydrogenase n=1 Tax=Thermoflavimicrobium dichotomicum TaxID=46223 RepID=A0A1I3JMM4_9BACL|nr:SDR family NAD(P)-dependent oxidoreductase [Thermoflavimicrobium dichotomicum]SFI61416.1 Short-chain dehydrogenase [Thermoflavimicrobium dichotomicum]
MTKPIAFITGTSSGIGLAASIELAKAGYHVIATMRDLQKKGHLLQQAKEANVLENIEIHSLDVTKPEEVNAVAKWVWEKHGRLDLLVNNAGIAITGAAEEIPLIDWKKQLETNFFGVVSVTQAFLPMLRQQKRGLIVNISSGAAFLGSSYTAPYTASKYAVEGFSESLRFELSPFGIHVVLVEPGFYQTNILQKKSRVSPSSPYAIDAQRVQSFVDRFANHAKDPQIVARKIVAIAKKKSPRMRYICGGDARWLYFIKRFVPFRLIEWFFHKI